MTSRANLVPIIIAVAMAMPGDADAGGQFAGDNGSQAAQRAGAFVAKADDPTAFFYNPAALFKTRRKEFFFGVNMVSFSQSFQRQGEYLPVEVDEGEAQPDYVGDPYPAIEHKGGAQPVPFIAAAMPHDDKITLGFGLFAPHGYGGRNYPATVTTISGAEAPAPQRYDAVSQTGLAAFPSAAASFRLDNKLAIGARVSAGFFQVKTRRFAQGLPNSAEDPARDTDANVNVNDSFVFNFGLGLHYRPRRNIEIGVAYAAPMTVAAEGTTATVLGDDLRYMLPEEETQIIPVPNSEAKCAPGGSVGAIKTCVEFAMPQTLTAGIRKIFRDRRGRERGDIEVDVRWENWSAVDYQRLTMDGVNSAVATPLDPTSMKHGYQDVYSIRIGGSRKTRIDGRKCELRFGVGYESAATPASWTRVDTDTGERYSGAFGIGVELSKTTRVDVGAAFIDSPPKYVHNQALDDPTNVASRVQPDVYAAVAGADGQPYHPFNAGTYDSAYLIGSVGITRAW